MPNHREMCPRQCFRFDRLPVGAYFRRCGSEAQARIARGDPVSGYEKANERAGVEMLLKSRGWGPGTRAGGRAGKYCPAEDNPCVFQLSRKDAIAHAEAYAYARMAQKQRRLRVA